MLPALPETGNPLSHAGATRRQIVRDLLLLGALLGLFFAVLLGSRPLSVPDEGRYVEIPREMVATGDYLTPRLDGVKYFEKPPLFYWFEAGLIRLFGLDEWSVRLGPALFALLGCLAVYGAGNRLFGRRAGVLSAVVLATSLLYYALSRVITLDMPVTVLLTAALLSFLLGTREPAGRSRKLLFWSFYVFAALATLTKGLIGIVIPGMIIFVWMLLQNEWRVLRSMHLVSGTLIFLAIAAPWHILVGRANPEFFRFYFIHEHFERYLTTIHGRYKPVWYFIPILLGGLLPWTAFLAQAVKHGLPRSWKERSGSRDTIFLLLWATLIFLFFSKSDSKLIPYILPVLPPLALLIGRYLADAWQGRHRFGIRSGAALLIVLDVLFIAALLIAPRFRPEIDRHGLRPHVYALAAILLLTGITAWSLRRRVAFPNALGALVGGTALFLIVTNTLMPSLDTRSVKPLALALRPLLRPGDEVICYRNYYQDLPVYLERTVDIAEWKGELQFGAQQEDQSRRLIDDAELRRRWDGPGRAYLVTSKGNYATLLRVVGGKTYPVADTRMNVLLSNREVNR